MTALVPVAWPAPEAPELGEGEVRIWSVALDGDDRERARAVLREVLAACSGADPASVRVERAACVHCGEPHGKPFLAEPAGRDLRFNLSHTRGLALVAVARGREVGVDVEAARPRPRAQGIAERWFTPGEAEHLRELPENERDAAFYRLWARKEAYLKATAIGYRGGLSSFDALLLEPASGPAGGWEFSDVEVGPGYAAALAVAPAGYSPGG